MKNIGMTLNTITYCDQFLELTADFEGIVLKITEHNAPDKESRIYLDAKNCEDLQQMLVSALEFYKNVLEKK